MRDSPRVKRRTASRSVREKSVATMDVVNPAARARETACVRQRACVPAFRIAPTWSAVEAMGVRGHAGFSMPVESAMETIAPAQGVWIPMPAMGTPPW